MTGGLRLGVLASGRGSDLQAILDASKDGRIKSRVAVVVTDHADAPALGRAHKAGIPAEGLETDKRLARGGRTAEHEGRILKVLKHFNVELVVLAGYMRLVSPEFLRAFPQRVINIHPALLPAFPGLHAQQQALEWGTRVAGCTTHFVDDQTDHGAILLQAAVPVRPDDTEATLAKRILAVEHQVLPRTIHLIEQGRARIDGRRVRIDPDASWTQRYPVLPDVLYGPGY